MAGFDEYYEARDLVCEILEADLVGPVKDDEVLGESPFGYYVAGKLYPQGMERDSEAELDAADVDDLENSYETPLVLASERKQSSMGLSFAVTDSNSRVKITVDYSLYKPLDKKVAESMGYAEKFLDNSSSTRVTTYLQRTPQHIELEWCIEEGAKRVSLAEGAELDIRPRMIRGSAATLVAVALINGNKATGEKIEDASMAFFQTKVRVDVLGSTSFVPVDVSKPMAFDPEMAELEMLYKGSRPFAQGHGVSADWDRAGQTPQWVATTALPKYEVKQMKPRVLDNPERFSMRHLAEAPIGVLADDLYSIVKAYEEWIADLEAQSQTLESQELEIALKNVDNCRKCAERMRRGVKILSEEELPLKAFRLANKAMMLQRSHSIKAKGGSIDDSAIRWYPFQLGFLLMEICSFAHPQEEDRETADLLWFPTGGGKTEAYLGVAAYAIFLRRLSNKNANGVTVIMRYTLRLLTLQQFERASALICAIEHLRRELDLGGDPVSIGMFVGEALTPNHLEDAGKLLEGYKEGKLISEGQPDPFQVRKCPWCGSVLGPDDYEVDNGTGRMYSRCPNEGCEFHGGDGIPAHVIDEDLYLCPPTFIVGTVDKFAQVPLNQKAASLLGVGRSCPAPELIIQDELHLISGPLGTMVGVYEAAIEKLCVEGGVHPKVITSTATARSSRQQQLSLYGEDSFQFPPQGLDMRDSFFAVEASRAEKPARMYYGVMGVDAAITNVAVRVSADLLFATRYLEDKGYSPEVVDSFWTIVEYFNTLRELGGSLTSLLDSVQGMFSFLASTKFKERFPLKDPDARYNYILELTSRRTSSEITSAFDDLERRHAKGENGDAVDFVLATNMLSVGVDIGRLGTMVVYGQPKMNSEYIQATSRVGRSTPGLVVSLLNNKRSRDRSHYEQFVNFHQALYRNVESSSLTPFSDRARDRSLHTLLVTLVRYCTPGMSSNEAADDFRADMDGLDEVKKFICDYVKRVEPEEATAVALELDEICEEWDSRTGDGLVYYSARNTAKSLFKNDLEDDRFRVMHSMRSVEPSAKLFLDRG